MAQNTQYRVLIPSRPSVASPMLFVGVAPTVGTIVSAARIRRSYVSTNGRTVKIRLR